ELWAAVAGVQDATRRDGSSGVRLRFAPGADRAALVRHIESDARFTLQAKPEVTYYQEQADTANALYVLVFTLASVMATGATFGALNTMYAAVASRTAEIGTLPALGVGRRPLPPPRPPAGLRERVAPPRRGGTPRRGRAGGGRRARRQHVAVGCAVQHDDLQRGDRFSSPLAWRGRPRRRLRHGDRSRGRARTGLA